MVTDGVRDGWAANIELDGPKYRRSRLAAPSELLSYFSITAVFMNSVAPGHIMASSTKNGVARGYPNPRRLQEAIDVYSQHCAARAPRAGGETDSSSWGYVTSTSRSHRRGPGAELNPGGRWSQVTIDLAEQVHRTLYG
jgi:hypothetical protein